MKYLHVVAEGQTEESFVRAVLRPHLAKFNVFVECQMVHTGGSCIHPIKGGLGKRPKFRPIRRALERWVRADRERADVVYTTFLDLYAFPKDSESPYQEDILNISDKYQRVTQLEAKMAEVLGIPNFIPYVQLHEFETFLLVDPDQLLIMYPEAGRGIRQLKNEIANTSVELINETKENAPSKRIIRAIPAYENQKSTIGPMTAEDIGLQTLRDACPHFNEWLTKLENLDNG